MNNSKIYYKKQLIKRMISYTISIILVLAIILVLVRQTGIYSQNYNNIKNPQEFVESLVNSINNINVECSSDNIGDSIIIVTSKVTANFDKNKVIRNYSVETIEKNVLSETYIERKKMYNELYSQLVNDNNTEYTYKIDDVNQTFIFVTYYKNIELKKYGKEEKKRYEIKNFIDEYESNNYKCVLRGISRKDL